MYFPLGFLKGRYKAIVNPMDIQTSGAVVWTCLKAVSIWLLSMLLAVPEAIFSQVVSMQGHGGNVTFVNCVPYPLSNQMHPKIHSVMIFLVYFLVPLGIISVYYFHIARTLVRSAHNMPGEVSEHTKRQWKRGISLCKPFKNKQNQKVECIEEEKEEKWNTEKEEKEEKWNTEKEEKVNT
ncbi:unnamed protein product [Arctogadus glacialis]